jgi:carbamoyltransferase
MLLNTSFNLAGDPIVETVDDAIDSLRRSKLQYLYMPEIKRCVYIPN